MTNPFVERWRRRTFDTISIFAISLMIAAPAGARVCQYWWDVWRFTSGALSGVSATTIQSATGSSLQMDNQNGRATVVADLGGGNETLVIRSTCSDQIDNFGQPMGAVSVSQTGTLFCWCRIESPHASERWLLLGRTGSGSGTGRCHHNGNTSCIYLCRDCITQGSAQGCLRFNLMNNDVWVDD